MRGERRLRRNCRILLRELEIQPPLNVATLCGLIAKKRNRPIRLIAHPIPVPGPFGCWIATARADYIIYQSATSTSHQDHIILHELGHLLAGHHSEVEDESLMTLLSADPGLTSNDVRHALLRTSYDTAREREAETVATIILEWASVANRIGTQFSPNPAAQRIGTSLNYKVGWL